MELGDQRSVSDTQRFIRLVSMPNIDQQKLKPEQEWKHVRYIGTLTERGLSPTREIIRNFAGTIFRGGTVSLPWVDSFIRRFQLYLVTKYSVGLDRKRHQADSGIKYSLFFELITQKVEQYNI